MNRNVRKHILPWLSIALVVFTELTVERGLPFSTTAVAASVTQTITVTLFGQHIFTRSTGKPQVDDQTFSVPPSVHAPFHLIVDSGNAAGANRVSSAHILLNDAEVAGPSDFNQQIAHIDRMVTANASNVLAVQLEGQSGSLLAISVTGMSDTVGVLGGLITVTDPASAINGATVQIPAGALTRETSITLRQFSTDDLQAAVGTNLPSSMRFAGGITIDAVDAVLQQSAAVSLPNTLSLGANDQLLVGRLDPTRPAPGNLIYHSTAQLGSLDFSIVRAGSYVVLSPIAQLIRLRGRLVDSLGAAVPGALVVSGNQTLLAAVTDSSGQFTIPSGPPATYGLLGAKFGLSAALLGLPLPTGLPASGLADLVSDVVLEQFDMQGSPFPSCPPVPAGQLGMRERQPISGTLQLAQNETVHTFVSTGESGLYGGAIVQPSAVQDALSNFAQNVVGLAFLSSLTVYDSAVFSISDPTIARFDDPLTSGATSKDGTLVGLMPVGPNKPNPIETADVTTVEISLGGFGLLFPCSRTIHAMAPVSVFGMVTSALPNGTVGVPYSASIVTQGGTTPLTWSIAGAPGLTISASGNVGVISGVPLTAGTNIADVTVIDDNGLTITRSFVITMARPTFPTVSFVVQCVAVHDQRIFVTIISNGWQPGESVDVVVFVEPTLGGRIRVFNQIVPANSSGDLTLTITLNQGNRYLVSEGGVSSGLLLSNGFLWKCP